MKTLTIEGDSELSFTDASKLADALAEKVLGEHSVCLSWYDKLKDHECPAHASECHDGTCEVPGYIEYASSRGAELRVDVCSGTFVFCYRSVAEFS